MSGPGANGGEPDMEVIPAHILLLSAEFFIPEAENLKAKRMVMNRLRDGVRREFLAGAAETGFQDKWQRSQWSFCFVGSDRRTLESAAEKLLAFLRAGRSADLTDYHLKWR